MQSGICKKCRKREKCKTPCAPVEEYLREDNLTAFQKNGIGKQGEEIRVAYPRSREEQRSSLSRGHDKNGDPRTSSKEAQAFSTENESPFLHYEANHKQTSIFIKRYFGNWSYPDIAQAHEISTDAARKLYHAAAKRLLTVIIEMDAVRKKMTPEQQKKAGVVRQIKYLNKNRDKVNAARHAHYEKNKDKINAARRANREKNREELNAKRRAAYAKKKALKK